MGRKWQILLLYCAFFLVLGGSKSPAAALQVVTEVEVTVDLEGHRATLAYTQPDKVHRVLNVLRQQVFTGYAPTDPERVLGSRVCLRVRLSDGSVSTYRQQAGTYLSCRETRWRQTDPGPGKRLLLLLWAMPPDFVANGADSCYNTPKGRWIP